MAKKRAVRVEVVPDVADDKWGVYEIARGLMAKHHSRLLEAEARIAFAWNMSWAEDPDGHVQLGKAKKASDVDRELHQYDFVIMLNREFFAHMTKAQRTALVHHELCHCEVVTDDEDNLVHDEKDRCCFRIRKHDIGEFQEVVAAHGLWKVDLERFAAAIRERRKTPLLKPKTETKESKAWKGLHDIPTDILTSMRVLCPKKGADVSSVEFSTQGRRGATLTAETRERINAELKRRQAGTKVGT